MGVRPREPLAGGFDALHPVQRRPQALRCDRLRQPGMSGGPLRQEGVGSPIEQQNQGSVGDVGATNGACHGHAAHTPDLHIDDDHIRLEVDDFVQCGTRILDLTYFGS